MTDKKTQNQPSITSKINDLDQRIQWFYSDDFSLDQALDNYNTATKLAKEINSELENLKNSIEVISRDFSK